MNKSYVSLEQQVCLVCGTAFETGGILFDKRLRASLERHTTTGWGLCREHQQLHVEGFVALIECDPERSQLSEGNDRLKPEQAYRTGQIVHLKREAFAEAFDVAISANQPCAFVEPGVIDRLLAMVQPSSD